MSSFSYNIRERVLKMMTLDRAIEIMNTEKCCVKRNEDNFCDRRCEKCDLVLPSDEILEAYDFVIDTLSSVKKE